jgi:hypothetical protein
MGQGVYARIKAKPQGLPLPYKIPTEYQFPSNRQIGDAGDVAFNLPTDVFPASSIEDNSNDQMSSDVEGTALI